MSIQWSLLFGLYLVLWTAPALAAPLSDDKDGTTSQKPGFERQDTGISDPTVNPGQAAGTRTVHGMVLRLQDGGYVIRDGRGHDITVLLDEDTAGDRDVSAGDYVETKLTRQGRAIMIRKESSSDTPAMKGSSTK
jgi:hypothetical protein